MIRSGLARLQHIRAAFKPTDCVHLPVCIEMIDPLTVEQTPVDDELLRNPRPNDPEELLDQVIEDGALMSLAKAKVHRYKKEELSSSVGVDQFHPSIAAPIKMASGSKHPSRIKSRGSSLLYHLSKASADVARAILRRQP